MRRTLLVVVVSVMLGLLLGQGFHANASDASRQDAVSTLKLQVAALTTRVRTLETGTPGRSLAPAVTFSRYGHVVTSAYQTSAAAPAAVQYTQC